MTNSVADRADRNALDDTLPGRVVQSALGGAYVAAPDYFSTTRSLVLARAGIVTSIIGLVGVLNARREAEEAEGEMRSTQPDDAAAGPLATWGVAGLVVGGAAGLMWLDHRINLTMAARLRRRGIKHPHTLFGAITAAGLFAVAQATN